MGESSIMGELICRDNLEVLCDWYSQGKREFIDLIYIDPPFGNNMDKEWGLKWNKVEDYTNWMYPRVYLMKEMLKPTGSFYYHCDPTASHYVKMMLDMIFGMDNFINELVWCYEKSRPASRKFKECHDTILYYCKEYKNYKHNVQYIPRKGQTELTPREGVSYLGKICPDWFEDIPSFATAMTAKERLGYPTQKPEKLLERIISSGSNPGDLVVDFYLGGGTTIAVAEKLDRNWIGIDINPRAIELSKNRV